MADIKELGLLFPTGAVVVCKGEDLNLKPLGMGMLPTVFAALKGMLPEDEKEKGIASKLNVSPVELFMEHSEAIIKLMALIVKKDRVWFDDLPPDEGLNLFTSILEVNADFFIKRVVPLFAALPDRLTGLTTNKT